MTAGPKAKPGLPTQCGSGKLRKTFLPPEGCAQRNEIRGFVVASFESAASRQDKWLSFRFAECLSRLLLLEGFLGDWSLRQLTL